MPQHPPTHLGAEGHRYPVVASMAGVAVGGVFLDSAGSVDGVGQAGGISISAQLENPDATMHGFEQGLTERGSEILNNLPGAIHMDTGVPIQPTGGS